MNSNNEVSHFEKQFFLKFSNYQDSDAKPKMTYFEIKSTITSVRILIQTMVEEVKLVVMLKVEFEFEHKSNLLASFGLFGRSKIWSRTQNDFFYKLLLVFKFRVFDLDPDGKTKSVDINEKSF